MKTTNEFYEELKNMQAACEAQLKADAEKLFGGELSVNVGISVHGIPWDMMPEGSKTMTHESNQWKHYNEANPFKPSIFSNWRKFKIVFEDEPESSNPVRPDRPGGQNPASSIQQPATCNPL